MPPFSPVADFPLTARHRLDESVRHCRRSTERFIRPPAVGTAGRMADREPATVLLPTTEWRPACEDVAAGLADGDELLVLCDTTADPVAGHETPDGVSWPATGSAAVSQSTSNSSPSAIPAASCSQAGPHSVVGNRTLAGSLSTIRHSSGPGPGDA